MFFNKIHAILEYCEAVASRPVRHPGPPWMLQVAYVPFRVRHKPEYTARGIAYTRYALDRAVGVGRLSAYFSVGVSVFEYYHTVVFEMVQHFFILRYEFSFPMSYGQIDYVFDALSPYAF